MEYVGSLETLPIFEILNKLRFGDDLLIANKFGDLKLPIDVVDLVLFVLD